MYNEGMKQVKFYTKLNCSTCDIAYQMLVTVALDIPLEIDILDITHPHNGLEAAYAELIPVIAVAALEHQLVWPFSLDDIKAYLSH